MCFPHSQFGIDKNSFALLSMLIRVSALKSKISTTYRLRQYDKDRKYGLSSNKNCHNKPVKRGNPSKCMET